jgi:RsiW-degrading membrane proteinase PrsW (M82 family)
MRQAFAMVGNVVFIKQSSTGEVKGQLLPPFRFFDLLEVIIGREPSCQIALDANLYTVVSRRHVVIRSVPNSERTIWEIEDLKSANGTYLNGQRLDGVRQLKSGDKIVLGDQGPEFIVEYPSEPFTLSQENKEPDSTISFTQLFPIISKGKDLNQKAFLIPAIFTVFFVVSMFAFVGEPVAFNLLLATYLAAVAYYYVYRLCGKTKPWWLLLGCCLTTIFILFSPILTLFITVFRKILPGEIPSDTSSISIGSLFINMLFGAGLMEELLKAIPIFIVYLIGLGVSKHKKSSFGIVEPLDGILIGTASAVGFTLLETLGQYVPDIISNVTLQSGKGVGELVGLQLLIPRIIGSIAGHMAYSGYLGYFIGLSAIKRKKKWQILLIGYLSSSLLHTLWNTAGFFSNILLAIVGVVSYAFLAAAILKARELSPSRSKNFATGLY